MSRSKRAEGSRGNGRRSRIGPSDRKAFGKRGARISLIARDSDRLETAANEVAQSGARAIALPADVSDARQVDEARARVENTVRPVDVGVNNAMTSVFSPFKDMTALNTPQFSWVLSRLPRKPQPVPSIFQPGVGAEAVYWASRHPRELLVGARGDFDERASSRSVQLWFAKHLSLVAAAGAGLLAAVAPGARKATS